MQYLLLMCGPAFSGKTVVATAFERELGCERISLDEINAERRLPPGGEGLPPEAWEASSVEAVRRVRAALEAGRDVVLDDTCCFRFLRDRYRAVGDELGASTVVVYLDVPVAELERRRAANRRRAGRPDVLDAVFQPHLEAFEAPDADEHALVLRPSDETVDRFVARVAERIVAGCPAHGRRSLHGGCYRGGVTDALRLRRPGLDDVDALQEAIDESFDDLHPWMDWCTPEAGAVETRAWVAMQSVQRDDGTAHEFVIVGADGRILGCCGVNAIDREARSANLGYWVRTSVAGMGVAVRAVRTLVDWVRAHTDLERLEIVCAVGNTRSQRVAEKVGAVRVGFEPARLRIHGVAHDAVVNVIVLPR